MSLILIYIISLLLIMGLCLFVIHLCGLLPFSTLIDYLFRHKKGVNPSNKTTILNLDLNKLHEKDKQYGNWLVHPCVRYIPEGFANHKWWLVVTPYPNHNSKYEQPVLFYGDGEDVAPPKKWIYVDIVQNAHENGFNSDPNLFYDAGKLWIFWKETGTENTNGTPKSHSIMARYFDGVRFGTIQKMAVNIDENKANVFAPVVLKIKDKIIMLATAFEHERVLDKQMPYGHNHLAIWNLNHHILDNASFVYDRTVIQDYPESFNFWHTDMCNVDDRIYLSVVSNEIANELLIGLSRDGFNYRYSEQPLLSSRSNNMDSLYKASIVVVEKKVFVFHPMRLGIIKKNRKSPICVTEYDLEYLLNILK